MKNTFYLSMVLFLMGHALFSQSKGKPIIDMHQHARFKVWLDENGNPYPRMCFPEPCDKEPAKATSDEEILKIALEEMDKYNIVKAVVSDENLEDVYRWQSTAPERFIAGYGFFSMAAADSIILRKELEARKIGIIGEIGVQYDGMLPNDMKLKPFFSLAEEFDIPGFDTL